MKLTLTFLITPQGRSTLGLDIPLCLALHSHNYNNKIIHQNRMSISLKVRELGGDSLFYRGACLIMDTLVNPILGEPWGGTEESIITIIVRCLVKA